MSSLISFCTEYFFGVRIQGEPANYPEKQSTSMPPIPPEFFSWSEEYRVGCQVKNMPTFW